MSRIPRTTNTEVKAAYRNLIGPYCYRVVYRNALDGTKRVLIGGLTMTEALAVKAKWGNPADRNFYVGPECAIESCDGKPDGAVLEAAAA